MLLYTIVRMRSLVRDAKGQDLIEYALLGAIIALGSVFAMGGVSDAVNAVWDSIAGDLGAAIE